MVRAVTAAAVSVGILIKSWAIGTTVLALQQANQTVLPPVLDTTNL